MATPVGEAFLRKPFYVEGGTDLVTLCRELSARGLTEALVRDGDRLGIFTTTNLRDALLHPLPPSELPVREVASPPGDRVRLPPSWSVRFGEAGAHLLVTGFGGLDLPPEWSWRSGAELERERGLLLPRG